MFLGVIGRPRPEHNFDGKILLEMISKKSEVTQQRANQNFSDDALINSHVKDGQWKSLYVGGMICGELKKVVEEAYDLDKFVGDRLEFLFKQQIGEKVKEK